MKNSFFVYRKFDMSTLRGKTVIISGSSRGIGQAIAFKFASHGASIVILAKEDEMTQMKETEKEIEALGGNALSIALDISDADQIQKAVKVTVEKFGGIDCLVNNTSATCFTDTMHTSPQQFDLMISTSVRAAFFLSKECTPFLKQAKNPHIINISPSLNLDPKWFIHHLGFSISKYAMSLCTFGMSAELSPLGIAVNSLWPESTIATATIQAHFDSKVFEGSRWPSIMGDAAYVLIQKPSKECTGHFFTDEKLLAETGVQDFSPYAVNADVPLMQALFVCDDNVFKEIDLELFLSKK